MGRIFFLLLILGLLVGLIYTQYASSSVSSSPPHTLGVLNSPVFPQSGTATEKLQYLISQRAELFRAIQAYLKDQSDVAKEIIRHLGT